jgi:hypothetical protein
MFTPRGKLHHWGKLIVKKWPQLATLKFRKPLVKHNLKQKANLAAPILTEKRNWLGKRFLTDPREKNSNCSSET